MVVVRTLEELEDAFRTRKPEITVMSGLYEVTTTPTARCEMTLKPGVVMTGEINEFFEGPNGAEGGLTWEPTNPSVASGWWARFRDFMIGPLARSNNGA